MVFRALVLEAQLVISSVLHSQVFGRSPVGPLLVQDCRGPP
jgi:hypothetical protein